MGSYAKLPRKIGRSLPYYVAAIAVFRRRVSTVDSLTGKMVRYKREYVLTARPLFFKDKKDAQGYCRQIAFANREAGMYDWEFATDWLGVQNVKVMEDAHGPNNGHACPRCNRMTLQGGPRDLCEGCSTAKP